MVIYLKVYNMIYLLQDCYKDNKGEYHDILKIGYSKDNFSKNRQGQYNTHNFGYKFFGEKEGSCELENYLHKLLKEYNLDREWFRYSEGVIDKFWKVREEDISEFTSQEELNEYIRSYILNHLVPSVDKLKNLYLNQILSEISEKDTEYEKYKDIYRREIISVFEFVSSRQYDYFYNLNFNSQENIERLKKYDLVLPKNKSNSFKNTISIYYKTTTEIQTREEFDAIQDERNSATQLLLNGFQRLLKEEQTQYIKKLRADIEVSKYSDDFVSISNKTGEPVHNHFIELAHERSWEISQKDYQDQISVTKVMEDKGYTVTEEGKYIQEDPEFLRFKSEFESTPQFSEKLKIYCEYLDHYRSNPRLSGYIMFYVKEPKYQKYYSHYGTSGCKAKKFREQDLEAGLKSGINISNNIDLIYSSFIPGEKYSTKTIKSMLKDIYSSLGISKTPKAKDLEEYFIIEPTKLSNQDTGKRENGFKIISRR